MSEQTVTERVARGAEWLDKVHPGWERRIDLARLDLSDGCRCIVGQLIQTEDEEGGYSVLIDAVKVALPRVDPGHWAWDHGFTSYTSFADLDAAWSNLIKARFDTGALSDAS